MKYSIAQAKKWTIKPFKEITFGQHLCRWQPIVAFVVCGVLHVGVWGESLISTTVGQVKDHIVTSREVILHQWLENQLFSEPGEQGKQKLHREIESQAFAEEAVAVLVEWAVFMEAKDLGAAEMPEEELRRALGRLPSRSILAFSENEIRQSLERKLRAKGFIRLRVESSVVPVGDSEVRRYYEDNRARFGDLPFENFKENIRSHLERRQLDRRLQDWLEVLRAKYEVRNFIAEI